MFPEDEGIRKAIRASTKGKLVAWDPIARKAAWTVEHYVPWNGGLLSTAGGLLFQGTGEGKFVAYEAETGKKLWEHFAQTGIIAAPVTYEVDGEQYVTVNAGWGGAFSTTPGLAVVLGAAAGGTNRMLTFKLGGKAELPPLKTVARPLSPPPMTAAAEKVTEGKRLYQTYCFYCHGDSAVSGGTVVPICASLRRWLRVTPGRQSCLTARSSQNGMISFAHHLKAEDVEARARLPHRARPRREEAARQPVSTRPSATRSPLSPLFAGR